MKMSDLLMINVLFTDNRVVRSLAMQRKTSFKPNLLLFFSRNHAATGDRTASPLLWERKDGPVAGRGRLRRATV